MARLAAGRASMVNNKVITTMMAAAAAMGQRICMGLIPEAFMASNSWSLDNLPSPRRIASKKAIGTVNSKKLGKMSEKSLAVCATGMPRVTTNSINFKIRAIKSTNVKAKSPDKNGGRISEIR
jgi:hypothetical protein